MNFIFHLTLIVCMVQKFLMFFYFYRAPSFQNIWHQQCFTVDGNTALRQKLSDMKQKLWLLVDILPRISFSFISR